MWKTKRCWKRRIQEKTKWEWFSFQTRKNSSLIFLLIQQYLRREKRKLSVFILSCSLLFSLYFCLSLCYCRLFVCSSVCLCFFCLFIHLPISCVPFFCIFVHLIASFECSSCVCFSICLLLLKIFCLFVSLVIFHVCLFIFVQFFNHHMRRRI